MGTNYFIKCNCCGNLSHIGKNSEGFRFCINGLTLKNKDITKQKDLIIQDECGNVIDTGAFYRSIENCRDEAHQTGTIKTLNFDVLYENFS